MSQKSILLTTDGGCSFRRMRGGYVIRNADSGEILETGSRNFGRGTSNAAEYLALIAGCKAVVPRYESAKVVVYTDSQLVVRQLKREYRIRSSRLRELHEEAVRWLSKLRARVIWHRRDEGDGPLADSLASGRSQEEFNGTRNQMDSGGI